MQVLNEILTKIKEYERIIIHGHTRPDGDCYGAQFGLKDIIVNSFPKKEVYVVGETANYVSFVGTPDIIEDSLYEGALSIVVDTATSSRISDQRYTKGKEIIKIDHHIPIDQYGDLIWVDTNFPSCAQMIGFFYETFKDELKISEVGAKAMYTGIVTDTGRFRYRGVSELTHKIAGMLISEGADIVEIDQQLSKESLEAFKFKVNLYGQMKFDEGFVYAVITKKMMEEFGVTHEEASSNVNLMSGIAGYNFWFLVIEGDNEIRLRLRSSGFAIDELANKYNGGGHAMASGAKLASFDELDKFLVDARQYVKEKGI